MWAGMGDYDDADFMAEQSANRVRGKVAAFSDLPDGVPGFVRFGRFHAAILRRNCPICASVVIAEA
jgi:hypothetical protein